MKQVLEILATTPGKLKREIQAMSREEIRTRPAPNKWSIQEVLAHLEDVEELGMRSRVAAMVEQERPSLPYFDQEQRATEMSYSTRDPRKSLDSWAHQRRRNVAWLRKLRPSQLKRKGMHSRVGEISEEELVTEWAFHDLGHLKQILEIKRYGLYPRIGNMRAFYNLT